MQEKNSLNHIAERSSPGIIGTSTDFFIFWEAGDFFATETHLVLSNVFFSRGFLVCSVALFSMSFTSDRRMKSDSINRTPLGNEDCFLILALFGGILWIKLDWNDAAAKCGDDKPLAITLTCCIMASMSASDPCIRVSCARIWRFGETNSSAIACWAMRGLTAVAIAKIWSAEKGQILVSRNPEGKVLSKWQPSNNRMRCCGKVFRASAGRPLKQPIEMLIKCRRQSFFTGPKTDRSSGCRSAVCPDGKHTTLMSTGDSIQALTNSAFLTWEWWPSTKITA